MNKIINKNDSATQKENRTQQVAVEVGLCKKSNAKQMLDSIVALLEENKSEDVLIIDLENKADFAYYVIVASGRSSKHICSIANNIADDLKAKGMEHIGIEGLEVGDWVLVDAHDVVVHLFRPEVRENYEIEKIWNFTNRTEV
ncbi:MAG: iojap family protein [Candidatus Midichloriaceae bacterium]|jgi:ribosome-associated protein|nr:iojap family protein [Candidatus Midichloriaceae bacterium]